RPDHAAGAESPGHAVKAVVVKEIEVGHGDQRRAQVDTCELGTDRVNRGAHRERTFGGFLDDDPVHHGVRERYADLHRVGATEDGRRDVSGPVGSDAGHEVGNECLAARRAQCAQVDFEALHWRPLKMSRTWATSLSPRPDKLSKTVEPSAMALPASCMIQATACADSSAGMMPSS